MIALKETQCQTAPPQDGGKEADMKYGIGIDIGGTKTAVVPGRLCGNLPADKLIL